MNPKWQNGGYYYPRCDEKVDADGHRTMVTPLEGNALLAYARLNVGDGLWAIYNKPWTKAHFDEPALQEVSSNLDVLCASFNASDRSLTFTLRQRPTPDGEASVAISNVWNHGAWELRREGVAVATSDGHTVRSAAMHAVREDEFLRLSATLPQAATFVLKWT
jgi:hypothetical protein